VAVYGVPRRPNPELLDKPPGRCDQLRAFAGAHGFELDGSPQDLALLDQAIDQATTGLSGPPRIGAALAEAGPFLGSVIVATVVGTRWRLWPNRHPVVQLAWGRDLDVAVMASDRVSKGAPGWPTSTPPQQRTHPCDQALPQKTAPGPAKSCTATVGVWRRGPWLRQWPRART
jgi:hypothetical protein